MRAGTGCCACRSMLPARPAGTARPGPRAWTGRTSPAAGMAGGRSGRSWPVGGAAGRRSDERLAEAGRAGGGGGFCAARCGSTARAGWQGWLLTVWPGLGQHGPGARRSPAAYRRGSGTCGPGDDASPPGAAGPLILIPPRTGPLRWGHSREVPRRRHAWRAAGRAVRHGPQDPRTAKAAGPAATGPAAWRGLRPWTTASGDAVGLWPAARRPLPPGRPDGVRGAALAHPRRQQGYRAGKPTRSAPHTRALRCTASAPTLPGACDHVQGLLPAARCTSSSPALAVTRPRGRHRVSTRTGTLVAITVPTG
jgi:hypothetical protein